MQSSTETSILRDPVGGTYHQECTLMMGNLTPLAFPEVSLAVERLLGIGVCPRANVVSLAAKTNG